METENTYTLEKLKNFLLTLSPEQLQQPVHIAFEDCPIQDLWGHEITTEDLWAEVGEPENCGSLEELKNIDGDDFDIDSYRMVQPKGTIMFF